LKEAEILLKQILELIREEHSDNSLAKVSALIALGEVYAMQDNNKLAEHTYDLALMLIETNDGKNSIKLTPVLNMKAQLELFNKNPDRAIEIYKQSINILEISGQPDYATLTTALCNLGMIYGKRNEKQIARDFFDRALLIAAEHLDQHSEEYITLLNTIAEFYQDTGSTKDALFYYKKALKVLESAFGSTHPLTAKTLCRLAMFYNKEHQPGKASELYMRALPAMESALGSVHPDLASALVGLSNVHISQDNSESAEPLLRRALSIRTQVLGIKNESTIQTMELLTHLVHLNHLS